MSMVDEIRLEEKLAGMSTQVTPEVGETLGLFDRVMRAEHENFVWVHQAADAGAPRWATTRVNRAILDMRLVRPLSTGGE
jgi:hypothetical protein